MHVFCLYTFSFISTLDISFLFFTPSLTACLVYWYEINLFSSSSFFYPLHLGPIHLSRFHSPAHQHVKSAQSLEHDLLQHGFPEHLFPFHQISHPHPCFFNDFFTISFNDISILIRLLVVIMAWLSNVHCAPLFNVIFLVNISILVYSRMFTVPLFPKLFLFFAV